MVMLPSQSYTANEYYRQTEFNPRFEIHAPFPKTLEVNSLVFVISDMVTI